MLLLLSAPPQLEASVVKIGVFSVGYDWKAPWRTFPVRRSSGSGFLISKGRIITNAHVVADGRQVLVKRNLDADPYLAKVVAVADDCDLAMLEVADPKFHEKTKPLSIGPLPKMRSQVTTYGFPAGGQELSSTVGVVSRIEWKTYVHTNSDAHIAIQTDAAINPGNSGGPVIQDGKVVGVAFQGSTKLQNVGFFIPAMILQHFLKDMEDGRYDGFPDTGASTTELLSPAYRAERGLKPGQSGAVVDVVRPGGTADGALLAGDVLLEIEGEPIDNQGMVTLGESRLPLHHLVDIRQLGEQVRFKVWRAGKVQEVTGKVRRLDYLNLKRLQYNQQPKYLIFAGLLFMRLERGYVTTWGNRWPWEMHRSMAWHYFFKLDEAPERAREETVVLARILKSPINSQMAVTSAVVESVNGAQITSLAALAEAIDKARLKGEKHLVFKYANGFTEALLVSQAAQAHKQILKTYGIRKDRNL